MSSGNAAARGAALLAYLDLKGVEKIREMVKRTEIELVANKNFEIYEKYCSMRGMYVKALKYKTSIGKIIWKSNVMYCPY